MKDSAEEQNTAVWIPDEGKADFGLFLEFLCLSFFVNSAK